MKTLKIIFTADIHFSNKLPFAQVVENGVTDRLLDQIKLMDQIYSEAIEYKADAIFILGDLLDKSVIDAVTLKCVVSVLTRSPLPLYILPGNHDSSSSQCRQYTVDAFGEMGNKNINILTNKPFELDFVKFHPVPYLPMDETRIELKNAKHEISREKTNVLLFHASVLDCDHLDWTCDDGLDPNEMCDGFDLVIGGHFHNCQRFGNCGMYTGAPMHHNFGDTGRAAGCWLIEFDKSTNKQSSEFIDLESPAFHIIKAGERGPKNYSVGDYVRIEKACTNAEWVEIEPKLKKYCEKLAEKGLKASYKQKPVYNHTNRLDDHSCEVSLLSIKKAISDYVDADSVNKDGLDREYLKVLGGEILIEAESE